MIRFETETGSTYEYDPDSSPRRVRRADGVGPSTHRVGYEWRPCHEVDMTVGMSAYIDWTGFVSPSVPGATPTTVTSRVTRIEKVDV